MKYYLEPSHKYKFVYFQNTKVASSTLRDYFNKVIPNELFKGHDDWTKRKYDSELYKNYFKFAFVRNPWDYIFSAWNNKINIPSKPNTNPIIRFAQNENFSFKEFVNKVYNFKKFSNGHWDVQCEKIPYQDLNFTGKIENLQEDFNTICDKVGIPKQELPHKNKTEHKHYTEYYDDETKEMVAKHFEKDIKLFNYKYGE